MSELCLRWSIVAVDVSLKALLLALIIEGGIRLLRVRRSDLKHAAWVVVLLGMICLPWLSAVLPAIPVPLPLGPENGPAAAVADSSRHALPTVGLDAGVSQSSRLPNEETKDLAGKDWRELPRDSRSVSPIDHGMIGVSSSAESATSLALNSARPFVLSMWPTIAFTIWGLGVLVLLARLLLAVLVTRNLVRRSTPVAAETDRLKVVAEGGQITPAAEHAWRNVGLRESADIVVPLTTGILHPQILSPTDWKTWPAEKLTNVLVHELTHICKSSKQGDFRIDDTTQQGDNDQVTTDKNGRFEIRGLMAGNVYQMNSANVRRFTSHKNRYTIDLTDAKPGDFIELGEVTGKNAKRKEHAKVQSRKQEPDGS